MKDWTGKKPVLSIIFWEPTGISEKTTLDFYY